ncbi:hypothetical protein [Mycolicibacterium sp. P9-64]|uniref:hypothetical protein n=1 Tax=Mycolicibacterium sp. P9-64 TaxID=2024612 RepID=UPI001F5C040A|nr:hypothetical protein [Mycolicibacterium sp. P9-64]
MREVHRPCRSIGGRPGSGFGHRGHTRGSVRRAIGLVIVDKRFFVNEQALGVDRYVFFDEDGFDGW